MASTGPPPPSSHPCCHPSSKGLLAQPNHPHKIAPPCLCLCLCPAHTLLLWHLFAIVVVVGNVGVCLLLLSHQPANLCLTVPLLSSSLLSIPLYKTTNATTKPPKERKENQPLTEGKQTQLKQRGKGRAMKDQSKTSAQLHASTCHTYTRTHTHRHRHRHTHTHRYLLVCMRVLSPHASTRACVWLSVVHTHLVCRSRGLTSR